MERGYCDNDSGRNAAVNDSVGDRYVPPHRRNRGGGTSDAPRQSQQHYDDNERSFGGGGGRMGGRCICLSFDR